VGDGLGHPAAYRLAGDVVGGFDQTVPHTHRLIDSYAAAGPPAMPYLLQRRRFVATGLVTRVAVLPVDAP
jgi:hypothetical protein